MNLIPYGKQHITQADIDAVIQTLTSEFLTQGPAIADFEKAFAAYIGCRYAVAVSNGTAALHLAAMALGVNEHSHVITTPITFAASANCVRYCGGKISFADIDPATATIDIKKLKAMLEAAPRGTYHGIIPVDFAGYPVNLEAIRELADAYGLWILEDACHAPGGFFIDSRQERQFCGNGVYANAAIFSFHPVKHIACGEGGMITTNDDAIYRQLLLLRTHGITKDAAVLQENHGGWYYEMQELGYNYRLTDFQAALGLSQLQRAEAGITKRREIAKKYDAAFENNKAIQLLSHPAGEGHAYHLYIIQVARRKELYDYLKSKQIFTQVHYIPVHMMPYYRGQGFKQGDYPAAEAYYKGCLSLPMYPTLSDAEQDYVISEIEAFLKK